VAAILVYAELSEGKVATTSLELMAKARELGEVYAVALGSGAKAAAATLGKHGAKAVHVNEDSVFDDYIAEPATDALASLVESEKPDLILFGFTSDSREVAGRLAARLGVGLISNDDDLTAKVGDIIVFRDDNHLTAAFAAARWRQFAAALARSDIRRRP